MPKATKQIQTIKQIVLQDIEDAEGNGNTSYLDDLMQHGCISGMVPELIYYSDTYKFYDDHYDEIETIRQEWEDETGEPIDLKGHDLKNYMAWFAYEYVANQILNEGL